MTDCKLCGKEIRREQTIRIVNGNEYHSYCITKKIQEECPHDREPTISFFRKGGIRRTGMYCPDCGLLLDYIPQYNGD